MDIQYKGRWAFIVGGSVGIGYALAQLLLSKGAQVLIIARNAGRLAAAASELEAATTSGAKVRYLAVDATDEQAMAHAFAPLFAEGIRPYFLFNCAGRALPDYFERISSGQLEESFRLNVLTAWNAIKTCLPEMKKSGGYIINTSSVAGFVGVFGYTDYAVTKFGLIGFSEALKSELEQYHIKVAVLCPPDTDTPGYELENQTKPAETQAISANAKLMSAEEVAKACLRQLEKGNFILLANLESKLTFWLKRFFPGLLYWIMQRDVRRVQKKS
jgi:3-dehydrosphinganine reductase